jgi:hypothetical protein
MGFEDKEVKLQDQQETEHSAILSETGAIS